MFKIDLHVHTRYSPDAFTKPSEAISSAVKRGLDGIAITDHDTMRGAWEVAKTCPPDFTVLPGVEIDTSMGHVVALGVAEVPRRNLPPVALMEEIHDLGGIVVLAHPFSLVNLFKRIGGLIKRVDALEVANSRSYLYAVHARKAWECARSYGLGVTAGSDSHIPDTIGDSYVVFNENPGSVEDL
ncbi:MAG: PHP domain-containing protein, partial [Candidatus Geothermarchaeales archaeon]